MQRVRLALELLGPALLVKENCPHIVVLPLRPDLLLNAPQIRSHTDGVLGGAEQLTIWKLHHQMLNDLQKTNATILNAEGKK